VKLVLTISRDQVDDQLHFARQIGCDGVLAQTAPNEIQNGTISYAAIAALKGKVEEKGLSLEGMAMLPWHLCYKWMLGLPGRDEQIDLLQSSLRNLGAAGVPLVVFNMHALRYYRTRWDVPERGGAISNSFEMELVANLPLWSAGRGIDQSLLPVEQRRPISDEEMWDNYAYMLRAVVPVAEEAGVKLALHPDDPPVPQIGGVARIMRSPEAFRRALEVYPSDYLGLKFCVGCWSEMGADVAQDVHYFGEKRKIFLVDFRNIRGTADSFHETFLDNGQENRLAIMQALVESGYDGPISPDHAVMLNVQGDGNRLYWAWAIGHMRALLQGAQALTKAAAQSANHAL